MTATGETHLIMIKNAEHSLVTGLVEVVEAVSSFMHDIFAGYKRPTMTWKFGRNGNNGTISIETSVKPEKVILRHADTLQTERRDWRLITGADPCPWIKAKGACAV
jgi:PhoPQ-activated pathogenicity-related protein